MSFLADRVDSALEWSVVAASPVSARRSGGDWTTGHLWKDEGSPIASW